MISLEIGTGTVLSGTFAAINWASGNYYLKTETDPTGGTNYTIAGTSQLLSVPYAMYAKSSGGGGGSLTLPYIGSATNTASLLKITNNGDGAALDGSNNSTVANASALIGTVLSTSPGGFSSGVRGINNGTGGLGIGVWGSHAGSGWGTYGTTVTGYGTYGYSTGAGTGVVANSSSGVGLMATSNSGITAQFINTNNANNSDNVQIRNSGLGTSLSIQQTSNTSVNRAIDVTNAGAGPGVVANSIGGHGVWGITGSLSTAGVLGDNPTGEAVVGRSQGGNGIGAVVGRNDNAGYGVRGFNTRDGIGVFGQAGVSGGTGRAARFENTSASNGSNVLEVANAGSGNLAVFTKSGANVARINNAGRGYFNGGTQINGADLAEAFDIEGSIDLYEPGDILVISTNSDRAVEKSSTPYSTLVAGVYATKPGVLLSEEHIDSELSGKVPMGVIGVIPTKVCLEGGAIKRGDLLVTSSISGVAMKGNPKKVKVGQVLGKALQDFNQKDIQKINVLVSIK